MGDGGVEEDAGEGYGVEGGVGVEVLFFFGEEGCIFFTCLFECRGERDA